MDKNNKKNLKNIDKSSCLVSKEILLLLEWLLIYDNKILDNFIKKIWNRGFQQMSSGDIKDELTLYSLDAQQVIFDFFAHLEKTIDKLSKEKTSFKKNKKQNNNIYDLSLENNLLKKNTKDDDHFKINTAKQENLKSNDNQSNVNNVKEKSKKDFYKNFLKKWNTEKMDAE